MVITVAYQNQSHYVDIITYSVVTHFCKSSQTKTFIYVFSIIMMYVCTYLVKPAFTQIFLIFKNHCSLSHISMYACTIALHTETVYYFLFLTSVTHVALSG